MLLVLLGACKGDDNLNVLHEPPTVTIVEPTDGSQLYDGQTITFRALVATLDAETDLTEISHSWVSGTTTMCSSSPVPADGYATCSYAFSTLGEQTVTVTAIDPRLDSASATITVNVLENTPPTIEITTPDDGSAVEPGDLVIFEAEVDDAEDSPDQITVEVTSNIDGVLGTDNPASDGLFTIASSTLSNGEHLIVFEATDSAGRTAQDRITLAVNSLPGAPTVHITPDPAPSGLQLTAVIDAPAVDPENDPITYTYEWYVDSVLYASGANPSVPLNTTVRDEFWEVRAIPYDGHGYGAPGTDGITIVNSPPRISAVTVTPSSPDTNDDLVATPVGWYDADGDPEQYRYEWTRNGVVDTAEVTDRYPYSKTLRGDQLQARIQPYDDYDDGDGEWVAGPTITIGNGAPTQPAVRITPTAPEPEDDLLCSVITQSTDIDNDPITYRFNWYQNGVLTDVTTSTLDDTRTADGDQWECRVTPNDTLSDGPYGSDDVEVIDVTPPDPPVLSTPYPWRNETTVALTGTCEPACAMTIYCDDSVQNWTEVATCQSNGTFSKTVTLQPGETTSCWAECEDARGNVSNLSNTVNTEVCDPVDAYEGNGTAGDTIGARITGFQSLPDNNSVTVRIVGNALSQSDEDWYLVSSSDNNTTNVSNNSNDYNFHVRLTQGAAAYNVQVYKTTPGGPTPSTPACTGPTTEYQDFVATRACRGNIEGAGTGGNDVAGYNICQSLAGDYYIVVRHEPSVALSCQHYELTITNGVW